MQMILNALSWCEEDVSNADFTKLKLLIAVLVPLVAALTWWRKSSTQKLLLPPGPRGLPLVGNLPFLHPDLHRCFAKLSLEYGPIFKVQLGIKPCIVLTSPETAKVVLRNHGANFADHDLPSVGVALTYGGIDIGFSPYGENWRMMRKVCVSQLLHPRCLEALYGLRQREAKTMVSKIHARIGSFIDIGEHAGLAMFNVITSMMWGNTLDGDERLRVTANVREVVEKIMKLLAEPNISDFFPVLARFDLQGKVGRMEELVIWFDQIFEFVMAEHSKMKCLAGEAKTDFLLALLQHINEADRGTPLTVIHIKALFLDMIIAATKTTSTTVEWAMAELLNQPDTLKKAQDELEVVVGRNNVIEERHLPQLPYLDAIVKETLRLRPPGPFLIPRCSRESCVINGYLIPKGAKIIVNAWAIQRDPKYWDNPLAFQPERFLNSTVDMDYKGNDFHYLPFGSGRRSCAGVSLAEKVVPYLLGSLLHSFNWELPQGTDLDLSEQFGLELKKKIPLVAIPTPRLSDITLY